MPKDGLYLGVDPGPTGGAALIRRVGLSWALAGVWTWSPTQRAVYAPTERPTAAAVEGLYLGKAGHGVLAVAEDAGRWLERIEPLTPERPLATRWRADLLRLPPATRAIDCDRAARALVDHLGLGTWQGQALDGHAVDAVCIGLWAAGVRGRRR